jgi:hypothetical protein
MKGDAMNRLKRDRERASDSLLAGSASITRQITAIGRTLLVVAAALGLLVGVSSVATAEALTETVTLHNVTETFQDVNPCTGDPVTVTSTYSGVFSYTVDPQGGVHVTGTSAGTFEVVPLDPSLPTYTGRFASWFGESTSSNSDGDWVTFNIKLRGSDGSTLSLNSVFQFHLSNGVLHVEFDKVRLTCGS